MDINLGRAYGTTQTCRVADPKSLENIRRAHSADWAMKRVIYLNESIAIVHVDIKSRLMHICLSYSLISHYLYYVTYSNLESG